MKAVENLFVCNKELIYLLFNAYIAVYLFIYLFIYLLTLGFQPVAVVSRLVQKEEIDSTKGETINKTVQKQ